MKWETIKEFSDEKFRRITGVRRKTFEKMAEILSEVDKKSKEKGGRPNKLSIENRILLMLEYFREYRTYAHIGASYGVSESTAYKITMFTEEVLIESKLFKISGKNALESSKNGHDIVVIDVTETPIERPKKNKRNSIQVKRKNTR